MKISLALSGGGARGGYHLGVLQYLDEMGIEIEVISGTSIGAVIGACYAAGISPQEQLKIFTSKEFKKAIQFAWFQNGIFKINENAPILAKLLPIKNIEDLPIPLHITALDIKEGELKSFSKGDILSLCLASSALVPIFAPIKYHEYQLVDGGIVENVPTKYLLEYNNPIVCVNLQPNTKCDEIKGWLKIFKRAFKIAWFYTTKTDLSYSDYVVENPKILGYSIFGFNHIEKMYEMGYKDAKEKLHELVHRAC